MSAPTQPPAQPPSGSANSLDAWLAATGPRITLQADLTWAGGMDGYVQAGQQDGANPYAQVWWVLEPRAEHCSDCPSLAANSPYDAPWVLGGNTLPATPGDGQTECGAGCKCSLQYEPPDGVTPPLTPMTPNVSWLPEDMPGAPGAAGGAEGANTPPQGAQGYPPTPQEPAGAPAPRQAQGQPQGPYGAPIGASGFTRAQRAALDLYRLAEIEWERVRGAFAPLPNFFQLARADITWEDFSWDDLTPEQKRALEMALEAFTRWQDAIPMPVIDPEDVGQLVDVDGRGLVLHNPYPRQRGGRFGFGPGGRATGGSRVVSAHGGGAGHTHGGGKEPHAHAGGIEHQHSTRGSGVARHAQARAQARVARVVREQDALHAVAHARSQGHQAGHTDTEQRGEELLRRGVRRAQAAQARAQTAHPLAKPTPVPAHMREAVVRAKAQAQRAEQTRAEAARVYREHLAAHPGGEHSAEARAHFHNLEVANANHAAAERDLKAAQKQVRDFRARDLAARKVEQNAARVDARNNAARDEAMRAVARQHAADAEAEAARARAQENIDRGMARQRERDRQAREQAQVAELNRQHAQNNPDVQRRAAAFERQVQEHEAAKRERERAAEAARQKAEQKAVNAIKNGKWTGDPSIRPPFSATSFASAMDGGKLERFRGGINDAGHMKWDETKADGTVVHHDYMVKGVGGFGQGGAARETRAEAASLQIGHDVLKEPGEPRGYAIAYKGKQYVVVDWREGYKNGFEIAGAGRMDAFSRACTERSLQQVLLHDYLVNDPDRHFGNIMVKYEPGKENAAIAIDHGFSLQPEERANAMFGAASRTAWAEKVAARLSVDAPQRHQARPMVDEKMFFNKADLRRITSAATETKIMKILDAHGLSDAKDGVRFRLRILRTVAAKPKPSYQDLADATHDALGAAHHAHHHR